MGPERPIATIVVFSDFQCPYCRAFAARLDSLRKLHPDVQVIERQLPLVNLHEGAYKAALAAECSADIGKYEQLRHTMFQRQGLVEDQDWGLLAVSAGIKDTLKILDCITEELHKPEVDGDMKLAGQIGITGTPGIVVNGFVHEGAISLNELEKRLTIRPGN